MKKCPLWLIFVIDTLAGAFLLCVFCYFHHVRVLLNIGGAGKSDDTVSVITKPAWIEDGENPGDTFASESLYDTGSSDDQPVQSDLPGGTENPNETAEPPSSEESDGEYDMSGQFGAKFGQMFLKKGEDAVSTDTQYITNDVRIDFCKRSDSIAGEDIVYYYYDIYIRNIESFYVNYDISERNYFEDLLTLNGKSAPAAAISGDFCGNTNSAKEVIKNGVEERASYYVNFDVAVLYWNGTFETITTADYDRPAILQKAPYQLWNFGPALLSEDGGIIESFSSEYLSKCHPRSVIGYYEPGHYCFVTVDGRSSETEGISLPALSRLMSSLGCKAAYNLDGGSSVYSYFNGNFVRYTDEERQENPRKIYDIICIG